MTIFVSFGCVAFWDHPLHVASPSKGNSMCFFKKILSAFLISFGFTYSVHADIVGGDEVQDQDPIRDSTAALYSPSPDGRGGALCTASLIGRDTAVTAAHCIEPGAKPVMLFGKDVHGASVRRPVVGSVVNPAWKEKQGKGMDQGDIAVVKFGGGMPEGYHPVAMDPDGSSIKKGDRATLAGYGISNARTHEGAGVLRKTQVRVADGRSGKKEMVLDQSHGHGACHGDSGGPAYIRRGGKTVLAGVTNRSYPNSAPDDCAHEVIYTKVGAYRPWIEKSEKKLNSSPNPGALRLQRKTLAHTTRVKNRIAKADTTPTSRKTRVLSERKSFRRKMIRTARRK